MSSNAITGSIPDSWSSGFHALEMLDLHGNQLSGALPTGFGTAGALSALNNLVLNNNQFSGGRQSSWPSERAVFAFCAGCPLAGRPYAVSLQACHDRMRADLETSCRSLVQSLQRAEHSRFLWPLRLSPAFCPFHVLVYSCHAHRPSAPAVNLSPRHAGSLPTGWGTAGAFPALQVLDVSYNTLTGSLPSSWGASGVLTSLNQLNVAGNSISGTVPASWGAQGSLQALSQLCVPRASHLHPAH